MILAFHRLATLVLVPLIASCSLAPMTISAAFIGDSLVFVAADLGDADETGCWRALTIVDDALRPVWNYADPQPSACDQPLFPLRYGPLSGPAGERRGARLETGRLYVVTGRTIRDVSGAFALTRAGSEILIHNVDPDSPAARNLIERYGESRRTDVRPPTEPANDAAPAAR